MDTAQALRALEETSLRDSNGESIEGRRPSQTQVLLELCCEVELFHTPENEGYATVPVNGHRETWPIKSEGFKNWLRREYFAKSKNAPCSQSLQDALATLNSRAQFEGAEHEVFLRVAGRNGKVYIDLCDDAWTVTEISSSGWNVLAESPIKFRRTKGMRPLPAPVFADPTESIRLLCKYVNLESDEDFKLVIAWLLATLNPSGPYPSLVLYGEQGSGKSTLVKVLRDLVDPNASPLRREPRNSDDLMVSAKCNWIVAIDNISYLPDWLSDDLCRLATGGGLSKRQHYSDDEEVVLNAKRPILANGIDEFVARGDLASRAIMLNLPTIESKERKREDTFWERFDLEKPRIFGALCSAVATALATKDTFELPTKPRMADAWHWASAAETAFGWTRGESVSAFGLNQVKANEVVLASSPLYPLLKELADENDGKGFEGNASLLLDRLKMNANAGDIKHLPISPRSLSDRIRRLAPALRTAGIEVSMEKTKLDQKSIRMIRIRNSLKNCVPKVSCVPGGAGLFGLGDAGDAGDELLQGVSNEEVRYVPQ